MIDYLVIGCGYVGARVARRWRDQEASVGVVTRSRERASQFEEQGFSATVADVTLPESLDALPAAKVVLFSVGYDRSCNQDIHEVYANGVKNVVERMAQDVRCLIYVSTTGVYGSAEGNWVDEQTPCNPQRPGGQASWEAEQILAKSDFNERSIILRLAGIYGPGRIPYLKQLRNGDPLAVPAHGWLNLIHVDDATSTVVAASRWLEQNVPSPEITGAGPHCFCVSDGNPVVRGDYYREVARQIGAEAPKFVDPSDDLPATSRAASDKRVSNRKMREVLKIQLRYTNYRVGLASILTNGR